MKITEHKEFFGVYSERKNEILKSEISGAPLVFETREKAEQALAIAGADPAEYTIVVVLMPVEELNG